MKKKMFFIVIVIIATSLVIYYAFIRRTAYSVGSKQVGFSLPKSLQVDEFKDEWSNNPSGDGEVIINFSVNTEDENILKTKCIETGFKKLPIKEDLPDNYVYTLISKTDSLGYYKLKIDSKDERDYSVSVLDLKEHKLYVYYVLM